jgi:predicted AAA+ superfamily ATPase
MIRRYVQDQVVEALKYFPVVLLTGARQVGKSTLAQALIRPSWDAVYLTLDDRVTLDAALRDPDGLISGTPTPAVIDEVQKAPDLMRAIKRAVDKARKPGRYLLTGSANVVTLSSVSESLAGRVALCTLQPFSWPELREVPAPTILEDLFKVSTSKELLTRLPRPSGKDYREQVVQRILAGGYPPPVLMDSAKARRQWFSSYRQTYLERDILTLKAIENIPDFNRLLSLAALRTGGLLNLSDLSRDTGLPHSTVRRYMNLLEVTYQLFLVRPYFANVGKRIVKTPKLYMGDTGMALFLRGVEEWSDLEHQGQAGAMVETWVASELLKMISLSGSAIHLYFWRTQYGHEVDFLLERGQKIVAIEVKWSQRIGPSDIANLKRCEEDLKARFHMAIILYSGTAIVPFSPRIIAVPFNLFFGVDV